VLGILGLSIAASLIFNKRLEEEAQEAEEAIESSEGQGRHAVQAVAARSEAR
jgi:hypothetical protein